MWASWKDDCRLKGTTYSNRVHDSCDNFTIEDANHVISQCPYHSVKYSEIFWEIENVNEGLENVC